jgi:hypothetical protein
LRSNIFAVKLEATKLFFILEGLELRVSPRRRDAIDKVLTPRENDPHIMYLGALILIAVTT